MMAAIVTEAIKLRRSRLWWITAVAFTVAAGVGGLFMFIGQDQQRARALGLLGTKTQLADVVADWPGFFALLGQIVAVGGSLIFGTLVIWIFGREYSDHTVKDLLALPTSRTAIVAGKFTVVAGWCLGLTGYLFGLGLVVGAALRLPGWSAGVAMHGLGRLVLAAALAVVLTPVYALAASVGRGYLAGIGALFVVVFLSQVVTVLGYGAWFPFAMPALASGIAGQAPPGVVSYLLVVVVSAGAGAGTVGWWRWADQHG